MTPEKSIHKVVEALYRFGGGATAPKRFGRFVLVADAKAAEIVLRRPDLFRKDYGFMEMLGKSRFNSDGQDWEQRRTLTQPHYNAAAGAANALDVAAVFETTLDAVDGRKIAHGQDLAVALSRAMVEATTRVFFRALAAEQDTSALIAGFDRLRDLMYAMQTASLCDGVRVDLEQLAGQVAKLRYQIHAYAERHRELNDLLVRLAQEYKGDARFDPVDELIGNFFAGIETSAVALSWAMVQLGAHPNFQEELRDEVTAGTERGKLEVFLNETLRCFPPIPLVTRIVAQDFTCPELSVRAGEIVLVSVVGVHQDPEHWSEPRRFDPRRGEFRERAYNRRAFIPFLYGPRVCGGAALARIELVEGLSALLKRYRFSRTQTPVQFHYAVALRPVMTQSLLAEPIPTRSL
jgi:cytochrome P450